MSTISTTTREAGLSSIATAMGARGAARLATVLYLAAVPRSRQSSRSRQSRRLLDRAVRPAEEPVTESAERVPAA